MKGLEGGKYDCCRWQKKGVFAGAAVEKTAYNAMAGFSGTANGEDKKIIRCKEIFEYCKAFTGCFVAPGSE